MSRYFAILADDGFTVENVIIADAWDGIDVTDHDPRPGPKWRRIDGEFLPPAPEGTPEPTPDRRVTRLAFRNRFTQAELVALEIASLDNPAATMQARQQAASLRVMLANLQAASWIDLQRPDTRTGVQQLEAAGLLGAGRALEILDAPIADIERPAA